MAFYIWLDKLGKEIKREEKGRGRAKKESQPREDGNFYIQDGMPAPEKTNVKVSIPAVKEEIKVEQKTEEKPETAREEARRSKKIFVKKKMTIKDFLNSLLYSPRDYREDNDKIYIKRPDTFLLEVGYIFDYATYAAFEINKKENTLTVWISNANKPYSFMIREPFILEETK
jgi:hypothetical protein